MPEEISGEPTTEWRCTGHVVRVEPAKFPRGKCGVGVHFYCYEASRVDQPDRSPIPGQPRDRPAPREPLDLPWPPCDPGALLVDWRFLELGLRGALGLEQGGIRLLQEGVQVEPLAAF